MKSISDVKKIDRAKWAAFVEKHPRGTVFQTPEMYTVYESTPNNKPIIIVAEENDEIIGVLLANVIYNGPSFLKWLTARCIITGGPIVKNDNKEVSSQLLGKLCEIIPGFVVYSTVNYSNL